MGMTKSTTIRQELNKLGAKSEAQFLDIVCNKYNNGKPFWEEDKEDATILKPPIMIKEYNSDKFDTVFGWGLFIVVSILFICVFTFIFMNGKCSR